MYFFRGDMKKKELVVTILHYLENTVRKFPNKTAVIDGYGSFSFGELRDNAISIAGHISGKLCGQTHLPILVYLPKGKECIASFMGIVYSGNIYTPTDVKFPFPKVKGIIDCLCPALIISDRKNADKLKENGIDGGRILLYEDIVGGGLHFDPVVALRTKIDTDPVYVFFTSGSTGIPKGVTVSHSNIIDHMLWLTETFHVDENTIIGNQGALYFDLSVPDVYNCIFNGSCLILIPEMHFAFPARLLEYMIEMKINWTNWVPTAYMNIMTSDLLEKYALSDLRTMMFNGEVMHTRCLNYWLKHTPGIQTAANLYGPTEATVACAYHIIEREYDDSESLPIGKACGNTELLLLDSCDNIITTEDVVGELCIRGASLSLGYWNDKDRTEDVFVQNPRNLLYRDLIYRTGDLMHYNENRELMFDNRKDNQIKHMGYRIELGEIEVAVMSLKEIEGACVFYDETLKNIVLIYSGGIDEQNIRAAVAKLLPKYMVPTTYYNLNRLPVNDNGKIDRRGLREEYIGVKQ